MSPKTRISARGPSSSQPRRVSLCDHYEHDEVGYNYRISNLLAAIGRAQLEGLPAKIARRGEIRQTYQAGVADVPGVRFLPESSTGTSNAWMTVMTVDPDVASFTAESLRRHLESHDVESRAIWKPMHLQPVFANREIRGGAVAEELFATGLCLPSGSGLTRDQQSMILGYIRDHAAR